MTAPAIFYKLCCNLAARPDLPASAKVLLSVIADRIGRNGRCWPGVRRLASDTGLNVKTIVRDVRQLELAGLLVVERRENGKSSLYSLPAESAPNMQALPKRKRSQNVHGGVPKMGAQALPKCPHNQTDQLNQTKGEAAAPPATDKKPSDSNGAVGRIMAAWCEGFKSRTGSAVAQGAKGKIAGTVKRLLADYSEADLSGAVSAWFAKNRGDYGVELFEKKLQGGDRDLLPRPEQLPPRDEYSERKLAEMRGQRP